MKKLLLFLLVVMMVATFALAGCKTTEEEKTEEETTEEETTEGETTEGELKQDVIKIGISSAMSGAWAILGTSQVQGLEVAMEEVNAEGGIVIGDTQYMIDFVAYDDMMTGSGGLDAANKLIFEDNVKFIQGPTTGAYLSTIPLYTENKIICLDITTLPPTPDYPYKYRISFLPEVKYTAIYKAVGEKFSDAKTVAVISPNTESGHSEVEFGTPIIESLGFTIQQVEFYEDSVTDFYPVLTALLEGDPDILDMSVTSNQQTRVVIKQARELGFEGPILSAPSTFNALTVYEELGDASIDCFCADFIPSYAGDKMIAFDELLSEKYGDKKGLFGVIKYTYDSTMGLVEAIRKAQSLDVDVVNETLEDIVWDSLVPGLRFGGEKTFGKKGAMMSDIMTTGVNENGEAYALQYLGPEDMAEFDCYK